MSGPQMMGPVLHCEYDLLHLGGGNDGEGDVVECRGIDYLFYNKLKPRSERRFWLSLDAGFYFSTGKDSDGNRYEPGENFMVALEPLLEVRGARLGSIRLNHGLMGITYDVLFGEKFSTFDNAGFKFRPIGVTFPNKMNASFTLRYYPRRFTAEDFGLTNPNQPKGAGEWVWGFNFGWLWKKEERQAQTN
jgi:hypothetical protein